MLGADADARTLETSFGIFRSIFIQLRTCPGSDMVAHSGELCTHPILVIL